MPEGPEVLTIVNDLNELIKDQVITDVIVSDAKPKLHIADRRNWLKVKIFDSKELESYLESKKLGLDVLSDNFAPREFLPLLYSNRDIYSLLLDQKVISGLGNIYVNEALFLAKILPHRKSSSLSEKESNKLYSFIKKACKICGSEIKREKIAGRGIFYCEKCQK